MKKLEKTIKAFGNITRLKILQHLKETHSAAVIDIAENVKCSYKAASKHLAILYRADIVDREQTGPEMHYSLAADLSPLATSLLKHI